ncbi:DUF4132 domain-containing protein [Kribbella sp. NPDC051587]|uniref:DUF4132 domain-containing protein n=1 Tax=Kribbella sp. NPDC051587 TaxID=3364119 RepID=UPI0037A20B18
MAATTTVPGELEQALRQAFGLLATEGDAEIWPGLAEYVLTGTDPAEMPMGGFDALRQFGLMFFPASLMPHLKPLAEFVGGLGAVPFDVLNRWTALLGAVLSTGAQWCRQPQLDASYSIDALLMQLDNLCPADEAVPPSCLDHEQLEFLLQRWLLDPSTPLVQSFQGIRGSLIRRIPGYDAAVVRHVDAIKAAVDLDQIAGQQAMLHHLLPLSAAARRPFAPEIARIVSSPNAAVRKAAEPLITAEGVVDELRLLVDSGKPADRAQILKVLWATNDPEQRAWARDRAAADRAPTVRRLVADWADRAPEDQVALEELAPIDLRVPMTPELRERLQVLCLEGDQLLDWRGNRVREVLGTDDLESVLKVLETGQIFEMESKDGQLMPFWADQVLAKHVAAIGPVVATVLLAKTRLLSWTEELSGAALHVYAECYEKTGRPEPLEIARLVDAVGMDGRTLLAKWDRRDWQGLRAFWPDEAIAPFVRHAMPQYLKLLSTPERWVNEDALFHGLSTVSELPIEAVDALADLALREQKLHRREAQEVLAKVDGIEKRIIAALTDGKAGVRVVAAQWLSRIGCAAAVPALETALAKEKNELAKAALLDALQAAGQPVEKYVDREALLAEANTALAKGIHKDIQWLMWDSLPTVHWADTGDAVPLPVLQWLINQAVKAKSPEPGALLRMYAGLIVPSEGHELGRYLLTAWITQDTMPISHEEAQQLAAQDAVWWYRYFNSAPQTHATSPPLDISGLGLAGLSQQEMADRLLPTFARRPVGSATASKGLLAVVAACGGEAAAAITAPYLKEWYGMRAAQCKALVAMLAWTDHPAATQVLLSVASRFRTKGIQEEAVQQAAALAERKGWTLDELADRTVPYAGFDEDGRLKLSFGSRSFMAELQSDLTVGLADPDGKRIKALPAPRQSDDEAAAQDAKKAFSASKRELKSIVKAQTDRLYESLCTGRTWTAADWQQYLHGHPILRRPVQRLAWVADGETVFRPLDDGSLTNVDDEPIKPAPDAVITLAHETLLPEDVVSSWQRHFADYEIVPLFLQFGRGSFTLPVERAGDKALRDFEGHLVEAFALRGRAAKLGYTRGETGDGGWFYSYEKRLLSIGLTVELAFTGNALPEENNTVALTELTIRSTGHRAAALRLGDVPPVLLAEAYNDLRRLAADGTGYDPDWQQKTGH